jgi:ribosomal protein S18 acetylase RimI-like enzyme
MTTAAAPAKEAVFSIAPLAAADFAEWSVLWEENNMGLCPPEVTESTWARLLDPAGPVNGFAAHMDEGGAPRMAGLVHYILHPVTGHIAPACYMQDLFIAPDFRRRGLGRALVAHLAAEAARQKWARLYWLAEGGNEAAQALYRTLGMKLDFSLHVMPLRA